MRWKMPQREKLLEFAGQYRYVLIMVVVGLLLLLLPTGGEKGGETQAVQSTALSVEALEKQLSQGLSKIAGAGETQVMLTVADDGQRVLAEDQRGEDTTHVVVTSGGAETVVSLRQMTPSFRGALVLCQGGDNPQVRLAITSAVSALTGLSSNKIAICTAE